MVTVQPDYFYSVKACISIINRLTGALELSEIEKRFHDEQPIIAREAAFDYYDSYIHSLLLGQGLSEAEAKEATHREITKILYPYIDPGTSTVYKVGDKEFEMPDYFRNGIEVSLVIGVPIDNHQAIRMMALGQNVLIIHRVSEDNPGMPFPVSLISLEEEVSFYEQYGFDTKNYPATIQYYDYDEHDEGYFETALGTHIILRTPFDWTGYDKPYWWGDYKDIANEIAKEYDKQKTLKDIISIGESQTVEFKPCLLYHFEKKRYDFGVRFHIVKAIAAFLNANGGKLFIGVRDDGTVQGLKNDFSLVRPEGKDPRDYFLLEADKLIREHFKDVADKISGGFEILDGIEIFVFTVFPNHTKPVFIKGQNGKEFYVRLMASSEPYRDIEDIVGYCLNRWGRKIE